MAESGNQLLDGQPWNEASSGERLFQSLFNVCETFLRSDNGVVDGDEDSDSSPTTDRNL
jgi:hypothetical protein